MEKGINLKKIKETEIAKRLMADLPPWWKKVRNYSAIIFVLSTALLSAGATLAIPAAGMTIIQIIMSISGSISSMSQFTKK